jgi:hypothetical protein
MQWTSVVDGAVSRQESGIATGIGPIVVNIVVMFKIPHMTLARELCLERSFHVTAGTLGTVILIQR